MTTNSPQFETIEAQEALQAPGPKPRLWIGNITDMRREGMINYYEKAWREHGDMVRFQMGPLTSFLMVAPEAVQHVLVKNRDNYWKGVAMEKVKMFLGEGLFTSEGELWRRQRRLMQPTFTPKAVMVFFEAMVEAIEGLMVRWEEDFGQGQPFDVNVQMMRLAMNIIGRTMFDIDIGRQEFREVDEAFTFVLEFVGQRSVSIIDIPMFLPTATNLRFKKAYRILNDFVDTVIEDRLQREEWPDDLLSILLQARDEETGEKMSRQQLHDEILTIFFAGHETTAQTLTWAWYLLDGHPRVTDKLHDEVDRVLVGGRRPQMDDLYELNYTRMIVEETLRLYPPAGMFVRENYEDDVVAGYYVPAGSMIMLSPLLTQRHPDYWDEPEAFRPERFTEEAKADRPRYTYFPFGAGQRVCIGNNFALLEATLALAMLARRYNLRLVPGQRIERAMVATVRPSDPVMVTLEHRPSNHRRG